MPSDNEMMYEPETMADATPPPSADNLLFSEPAFSITNINKTAKTIHIISNGDSATINIVIEIRQ